MEDGSPVAARRHRWLGHAATHGIGSRLFGKAASIRRAHGHVNGQFLNLKAPDAADQGLTRTSFILSVYGHPAKTRSRSPVRVMNNSVACLIIRHMTPESTTQHRPLPTGFGDRHSNRAKRKTTSYEPFLVGIVVLLFLVIGITGLALTLAPRINHVAHLSTR